MTWEPKYREGFRPLLETTHVPFNDAAALDARGQRHDRGGDPRSGAGRERRQRRHAGLPAGGRSGSAASAARCSSSTRSRPASAAPAAGLPSSTRASSPTSSAWPRASAAASRWARWRTPTAVRDVLYQGAHGSTFGGSPLACAAGLAAHRTPIADEGLIERSATLGASMLDALRARARRRRRSCATFAGSG